MVPINHTSGNLIIGITLLHINHMSAIQNEIIFLKGEKEVIEWVENDFHIAEWGNILFRHKER